MQVLDRSNLAARLTAAFAERIGAGRYQLWFPPNAVIECDGETVRVICRNEHFHDWSREQFGSELTETVRSLLGDVAIVYCIDAKRFEEPEKEPPPKVNLFGEREPVREPRVKEPARRWKTFKEFVAGPSNRVAMAAAQAVIDDAGLGPNPLVVFGPTGVGKTHLLEAVVHAYKAKSLKPLYLTAEEFTHRFIQSTRTHRTGSFRKQTRHAAAFILDDLQFLANKRATQEELLHLLDAYAAEGKPVVAALDTHPRLADDLLPELTDRLLGGAAWGLLPPDDETRRAILTAKSPLPLDDDVLNHMARNLSGNVRELEGALHTLKHYAKVTGAPITLAIAQDVLSDLMRHTVRTLTLAAIDTATCKVLKLPAGTLQSKARIASVTQPRMLAVYLARKHTAATYGEIAKHFGVRQHSTALAAEKKVRQLLTTGSKLFPDPAADTIARIERELMK